MCGVVTANSAKHSPIICSTSAFTTHGAGARRQGARAARPHTPPVHLCRPGAVEKNVDAFLSLDLPGTKCVIGDGPALKALRDRYPDARFAGCQFGKELARLLAAADVLVFPSHTDTFGLVMLEALACGVPVAAFPVTGPVDVVERGVGGIQPAVQHQPGAADAQPPSISSSGTSFPDVSSAPVAAPALSSSQSSSSS